MNTRRASRGPCPNGSYDALRDLAATRSYSDALVRDASIRSTHPQLGSGLLKMLQILASIAI